MQIAVCSKLSYFLQYVITIGNDGYQILPLSTGSGLDLSVDTSGFVGGEQHVLVITVSARYGSSTGTLRYTFRFTRQVTTSKKIPTTTLFAPNLCDIYSIRKHDITDIIFWLMYKKIVIACTRHCSMCVYALLFFTHRHSVLQIQDLWWECGHHMYWKWHHQDPISSQQW